jgi:radical SAM superfamily enzyme YgiQ (UPF0313 family)
MKVIYVNPQNNFNTITLPLVVKNLTFNRKAIFIPLNLCVCASVTPPDWDVRIVDECVEKIDFDEEADVVGVTAMTSTAPRAYAVADEFKRRGRTVVMGGVHPSALPDEALKHADSVCIGEAEGTLPRFFKDYADGAVQPTYRASDLPEPAKMAAPRRDLVDRKNYLVYNAIQATRGCPHSCIYCTTYSIFGKRYRHRPIEDIIDEIRACRGKLFIFTDDNVVGDFRWARQLFKALIPLRIKWGGQSTILLAKNEELLKLAAQSGCIGLILGLETTSQDSLTEAHKDYIKTEDYLRLIKRFQKHGIGVWGSFMFGFDSDSRQTCLDTMTFARKAKLGMSCYPILTPYPGTPLFDKLKSEGRLLTENWEKYNAASVVFRPRRMEIEELRLAQMAAFGEFFSLRSMFSRLGVLPFKKLSWLSNSAIAFALRMYYRRKRRRLPKMQDLRNYGRRRAK